jgi:hypothetical protein
MWRPSNETGSTQDQILQGDKVSFNQEGKLVDKTGP